MQKKDLCKTYSKRLTNQNLNPNGAQVFPKQSAKKETIVNNVNDAPIFLVKKIIPKLPL